MNHQPHSVAVAADLITDWLTDDDLSDEEEDQQEDENLSSVVDAARQRQDRRLLSSSSDSYESSESSNSDSDISNSSFGSNANGASTHLGKDKKVWKNSPTSVVGRTPAHNVYTGASGVPRQVSQSISTPYDAWKHFIPEVILRSIVKYTTEEAHRRGDTNFSLTLSELEAFIALQYGRGLYGKNHPLWFLFNKEYGISVFSKTMPRDRFLKILKYLRFDDKPNRQRTGPRADRFAPIREVFETFSSMCQTKYNCKFFLTIDEQLMPVKSRCPFITFMPNKPDKYGIKFWVLADVETKYVANIIPYLGAQEREERGGTPLAESVMLKLTDKIKGKGYNITCDNFFTSLPVAEKLARNKISIVGTIRKNRRELSFQMTQPLPDKIYYSRFMWHDRSNALFVNYQPKRNKSVCLLSTMHSSPDVDTDSRKQKPNVILFYNKNKVGVECFDQMTRLYATRSASRRWPLSVWGNILDIAAINAKILFVKCTGNRISRRQFIF